jgi:hypothetical protein
VENAEAILKQSERTILVKRYRKNKNIPEAAETLFHISSGVKFKSKEFVATMAELI